MNKNTTITLPSGKQYKFQTREQYKAAGKALVAGLVREIMYEPRR